MRTQCLDRIRKSGLYKELPYTSPDFKSGIPILENALENNWEETCKKVHFALRWLTAAKKKQWFPQSDRMRGPD